MRSTRSNGNCLSNSPRPKTDAALRLIEVLLKGIVRVCTAGASVVLLAIAGVVLYQIFARYALPKSPVWTEELSRYLFAYLVVLASGAVLGHKRHVNLELFHHRFSPRAQRSWDLIIHLVNHSGKEIAEILADFQVIQSRDDIWPVVASELGTHVVDIRDWNSRSVDPA